MWQADHALFPLIMALAFVGISKVERGSGGVLDYRMAFRQCGVWFERESRLPVVHKIFAGTNPMSLFHLY
jgi:hypothetical protein